MSEEIKIDETVTANTPTFWDNMDWDRVAFNSISKQDFLRIRSLNKKLFATFLGPDDQIQFYLFKPISWGKYKDIRQKNLDKDTTHEYIINACILWPKMDPINISSIDAGILLTLVNQILTVSNFLKNPNQALELILEIE